MEKGELSNLSGGKKFARMAGRYCRYRQSVQECFVVQEAKGKERSAALRPAIHEAWNVLSGNIDFLTRVGARIASTCSKQAFRCITYLHKQSTKGVAVPKPHACARCRNSCSMHVLTVKALVAANRLRQRSRGSMHSQQALARFAANCDAIPKIDQQSKRVRLWNCSVERFRRSQLRGTKPKCPKSMTATTWYC